MNLYDQYFRPAKMMPSTLQHLEVSDNMQTLYKILQKAHPDNEEIQKELGKLSNNKDTYIKQLINQWNSRSQPLYTEIDIKKLCSSYYANELENGVVDALQNRTKCKMDSRSWVIKTDSVWRGWDPESSQYFQDPILFEGEIKFDKYYEQLVVSDKDSGSVNLIWTIKKLITRGSASCLSDENWISLFLQFSRKYMPTSYTTLARYSDNLETLFQTLVTNINADEELAKLRSTMARLHRRPGEQLQVPLYKLKSYYELLLGINFPQLDSDTATVRADNYAANSAKYFVSTNTGTVITKYIYYKVQKGEPVGVMNICQVVGQHETTTPGDAIQSVMYLPEIATRLDTQMSTASNVEELVIASTRLDRNRGYSPKDNSHPPRQNASPARQPHHQAGRSGQNFKKYEYYKSPNGSRYFKSGSNYFKRSSSKENTSTPSRPGSNQRPRPTSSHRFRSQGGTNYYRSPGRSTWRRQSKSPTPNRVYNQNNRGRPQQTSTSSGVKCVRCGGSHESGLCPYYAYYQGQPCGKCGLMHDTAAHRHRSGSGNRSTHQGGRKVQHHQSEIVPGEMDNSSQNLVNYFEPKNY